MIMNKLLYTNIVGSAASRREGSVSWKRYGIGSGLQITCAHAALATASRTSALDEEDRSLQHPILLDVPNQASTQQPQGGLHDFQFSV